MPNRVKKLGAEAASECLVTRLRRVNRVITRLYDDALRPLQLRVSQMALLALAADRDILRQSDVGELLQMDDSTLSRNLERLRDKGWMQEVGEGDGRVNSHRLTPKGEALLEKAMPAWRAAQKKAHALLGGATVKALHRFMDSAPAES